MKLIYTLSVMVSLVLSGYVASALAADEADPIASIDIQTGIPFGPHYTATVSIDTGANGDLETISISGNIPGMTSTQSSIVSFASSGYSAPGPKGTALSLKFIGSFTATDGGSLELGYLSCSGGMSTFPLSVERSAPSSDSWELEENNHKVYTFDLTAQVGLSGWTGCFTDVSVK